MSFVHTLAPRPYSVSLASRMASSRSLTRHTGSTGPNVSSRATRLSTGGLATIVGSMKWPAPPRASPPGSSPRPPGRVAAEQQLAAAVQRVLELLHDLRPAVGRVQRPDADPRLLRLLPAEA